MNANNGVSIIVCCYNSSDRLPETLKYLAGQELRDINAEVIIVDNNSTDNTKEVALGLWADLNSKVDFKVVQESLPGLSFAREKGVRESKYEYIIFCDDDNWLCSNYVQLAFDMLQSDNRIAAVGGYSEPVFESGIQPEWFITSGKNFAVGKQAESTGIMKGADCLWGAGMGFKKLAYYEVMKYKSLLTDRKGSELSSGGDFEMCLRFILKGYKLYYHEGLYFKHFIPSERSTASYFERLLIGQEKAWKIIEKYQSFIYVNSLSIPQHIVLRLRLIFKKILSISGLQRLTEFDQRINTVLFNPSSDEDYRMMDELKANRK